MNGKRRKFKQKEKEIDCKRGNRERELCNNSINTMKQGINSCI